jgi:hypothetical protein
MRSRYLTRLAIAIACAGAACTAGAFFGCVDLFHSTDFPEADAGPIDFCALSEPAALATATHACALLSACQTPVGNNAVGACLANATLAYDCTANPNRPVIGPAHAYWDCLARSQTCDDISACVYASPPQIASHAKAPICSSAASPFEAFTACQPGTNATTRLDCRDSGIPAFGESCLATGQSCVNKGQGEALCVGSEGIACTRAGCNASELNFCVDAGGSDSFDRGVDCASYGGGACVSSTDAGVLACLAVDGGACTAKNGISCTDTVASGCGSGVDESVNCRAFGPKVTCNANPNAPAYDIAAACFVRTPECTVDVCSTNGALVACERGGNVNVDCASLGLGTCVQVPTTDGTRVACGPPQ